MSSLAFLPDRPRNATLRDAYQIADKRVPQLASLVSSWARSLRSTVDRDRLIRAVRRQDVEAAVQAFMVSPVEAPYQAFAREYQRVGRLLMTEAGQDALDRALVDARFRVSKRLEIVSEVAQLFLRDRSSSLVTDLSQSQRETLRAILADVYTAQERPEEAVEQIMDVVGLTHRDAAAARKRYVSALAAGASRAQARKVMAQYSRQALARRARTIARTETTDAQAEAQTLAWREAAEAGELPSNTRQEWGAADRSPRLSDICRELDTQTVDLGQPFWSDVLGRYVNRPPAHPNCRSVLLLRFG